VFRHGDSTDSIYDTSETQRSFIDGVTVQAAPEPTGLVCFKIAAAAMRIAALRKRAANCETSRVG